MRRLILIFAALAVLLGGALVWLASAPTHRAETFSAPTAAAPAPDSGPGDGGEVEGPDNSFIVCPGHPRCPG